MKITARDGLPRGVELTSLSNDFRNDPNAVLSVVRNACPVHHDGILRDYVVTDSQSAKKILSDLTLLSDPRSSCPASTRRMRNEPMDEEPPILFSDDPRHRRLRGLLSVALSRARIEAARPMVRRCIEDLLSEIKDEKFDFIECISRPLPTMVIAAVLGVDKARHTDFKQWSDDIVAYKLNPLASGKVKLRGEESAAKLIEFVEEEVTRRVKIKNKPDDLISAMINARIGEDKLSVEEICQSVQILLVAGNQTTTDFMGTMLANILEIGGFYRQLCEDPTLIDSAIEESIRFEPPIFSTDRIAPSDIEYRGTSIPKGYGISVMLSAANHDPQANPNPDVFNIHRKKIKHWSFGGGRHFCMGAPLARLEAQELLLSIIERMPNLMSAGKPRKYSHSPGFRGLESLWLVNKE